MYKYAKNCISVANEFIRLGAEDGRIFTPLQIIKIVYIAHGWMLTLYQRPLINETVEAWKYGPMIPSLYHKMKRYGAGSVTHLIAVEGLFHTEEKDLEPHLYFCVNKSRTRMGEVNEV